MKIAFLILAATVAALLAVHFFVPEAGGPRPPAAEQGMPWQVETLADGGSRVFGLTLAGGAGGSTLSEARRRLGNEPQVAAIVGSGEMGSLEAYFETVSIGPVTGRVILTLEISDDGLGAMINRATKAAYMEGSTRRITLSAADLAAAEQLPVRAVAFIPSASLDEATVLQRFGAPAERIRAGEHAEHFLYPAKGLDLVLDAKGKEVLQYVAPKHFARLRDPLRAGKP